MFGKALFEHAASQPFESAVPFDAATAGDELVLQVQDLSCGYGDAVVVDSASFEITAGEVLAIIGPNGVGKTTLFKTLLGFLPAISGDLRLCGEDARTWSRKRFASTVAYIPQQHDPAFPFSVSEFVLMGRTPALDGLAMPGERDEQVVQESLGRLGIEGLADRDYTSLSGGERQMVLIARALAQQPRLLVMDEPCASLDYGNQVRLLEQVIDLSSEGLAVVMTTHDPNHAFMMDGKVLCMMRDKKFAYGNVRDTLDERLLASLYGVEVGVAPTKAPDGSMVSGCIPFLGAAARSKVQNAHRAVAAASNTYR